MARHHPDPSALRGALARQRAQRFARSLQSVKDAADQAQNIRGRQAHTWTNPEGSIVYTLDPWTGTPIFDPTVVTTVYTPTQPDVNAGTGMLSIEWDGTYEDGDWDNYVYVVHVHAVNAEGNTLNTHNHIGTFMSEEGGTMLRMVASGETKWIYLRMENIAGVLGPASVGTAGTAL